MVSFVSTTALAHALTRADAWRLSVTHANPAIMVTSASHVVRIAHKARAHSLRAPATYDAWTGSTPTHARSPVYIRAVRPVTGKAGNVSHARRACTEPSVISTVALSACLLTRVSSPATRLMERVSSPLANQVTMETPAWPVALLTAFLTPMII